MRRLFLAFLSTSSYAATVTFTGSATASAFGPGMTDTVNNVQTFYFEIAGPPTNPVQTDVSMVGTFSDSAEVGFGGFIIVDESSSMYTPGYYVAPDFSTVHSGTFCCSTTLWLVPNKWNQITLTTSVSVGVGLCLPVGPCSNTYSQSNFAMVGFDSSTYPNDRIVSATTNPVPEPASAVLVAVGLLTLGFMGIWMRRRDAIPHRC